jgi:hypothetical protein
MGAHGGCERLSPLTKKGNSLATIWLPFLAKFVWLNVPLLMEKQHSPTGTRWKI